MKKIYIAPELTFSEGQFEVVMVNLSPKQDGIILDEDGRTIIGGIEWGGSGKPGDNPDGKERGWDVFGE